MNRPPDIVMPERPRPDRALDEDVVRRTLAEQFPELALDTVVRLASGWSSDAYLVDGHLVVRFPRNAEVSAGLDLDAAILEAVHASLGPVTKIPLVSLRGRGGEHFPHPFVGYEAIPGIPADHPEAPLSEELARELGQVLTHIHTIPMAVARKLGLQPEPSSDISMRRCFIHGDFMPDNLIVDPESGSLVGIVDWGNATLGDPALDFIWLVMWRGWSFARDAIEAYGLPVDDRFEDRVRFHAQLTATQWLADTVRRGGDPTLHLSWVRNAFGMDLGG